MEDPTVTELLRRAVALMLDKLNEHSPETGFLFAIVRSSAEGETELPVPCAGRAHETTDRVVSVIDNVRSQTTQKVVYAARGLVFGLIAAILGTFALVIGIIGLAGIVVNNSLILVDFINKGREAGLPRREATLRACRLRLRPILLTSVTTIFGLLPLAVGLFGLSAFLTPIAVAIVWGLTFATFLTLLLVPGLYAIVDDVAARFGRSRA